MSNRIVKRIGDLEASSLFVPGEKRQAVTPGGAPALRYNCTMQQQAFLLVKRLWYDASLGRERQTHPMSSPLMTNATTGYLVPAGTVVEESGESAPLELGPLAGKTLLLMLQINEVVEQESLHVSVWGSSDGQNWGAQALFWFPQKFYVGVTPAAVDLGQRPEVKFLQARWEANRWGRGIPRPRFGFALQVQVSVR